MTTLLIIIHIIVCVILVVAVLMQSGKAADLAGAFGGIGSQTAFGPRGAATLLSKITTICAVLFMLTSLGLWITSSRQGTSVLRGQESPKTESTAKPEGKKEQAPSTAEQKPADKQETPAKEPPPKK